MEHKRCFYNVLSKGTETTTCLGQALTPVKLALQPAVVLARLQAVDVPVGFPAVLFPMQKKLLSTQTVAPIQIFPSGFHSLAKCQDSYLWNSLGGKLAGDLGGT